MKPKILLLDIEIAPILAYCWGLWKQNIAVNQIKDDWFILSWSAKWLGEKKIMYEDQRNAINIEDDSKLLNNIWKLLDEADVVVGHNSKKFDIKKLNARFILNGLKRPSPYKQIDTLTMARKHFAFTSNKLEYLSNKLCKKYKKLKHEKFNGFELWSECIKGNKTARREMEKYNKTDVLALEELYNVMQPWDMTFDFGLFVDDNDVRCNCGSKKVHARGYAVMSTGKYHKYQCQDCGSWSRGRTNVLSEEKKNSLRRRI